MKSTAKKFLLAAVGAATLAIAPGAFAADRHRIPLPHEVLGLPAPHEVIKQLHLGHSHAHYRHDHRYDRRHGRHYHHGGGDKRHHFRHHDHRVKGQKGHKGQSRGNGGRHRR